MIPYKTHFADVERARTQLLEIARDTLAGRVPYGSPVTDFLAPGETTLRRTTTLTESEGEPGFLDHLAALEEGFERLAAIVTSVGADTQAIGAATTSVTERLNALAQNPDSHSARQARTLVIGLAQKLSAYASGLAQKNEEYAAPLGEIRTALEFVVRSHELRSGAEREQIERFYQQMQTLEENAQGGRSAFSSLAETIRGTPKMERSYNRASDRAFREIQKFADNIDQTISIISRAREVAESKLQADDASRR